MPYEGLDTDSAPDAMPFTRARVHQNWLPGFKGKLPVRGPLKHVAAHHDGTETGMPIAAIPYGDNVLIVRRARDGTAVIDPWKAPYILPASANALADHDANMTLVAVPGGTTTAVSDVAKGEMFPGPRYIRLGSNVYAIAYDVDTTAAGDTVTDSGRGIQKLVPVVRWNGTTAASGSVFPMVPYRNAPVAMQDITLHYERIFVLGGLPPSLVFNPGGEPDNPTKSSLTTGWVAVTANDNTFGTTANEGYFGIYAYKLQRDGDAGGPLTISMETNGATYRMGVTPNTSYRASVRVRSVANSRTATLTITFYDSAGAALGSPHTTSSGTSVGAWITLLKEDTVPDGAVTAGLKLSLAAVPETEIHYADDWQFRSPGEIQWNTLWYTDPVDNDRGLDDTAAKWIDDTSNLVNQIEVDANDQSDYGVGLARVGGNLVIFKRNSIHVLYGYSPATWNVKAYTREFGCIDVNSICEYDNGVIFMSQKGLMFFDGSDMAPLTSTITQSYEDASAKSIGFVNHAVARNRDSAEPQGCIHVGALPGDFVMVNHQYVPVNTGSAQVPVWHGYINMKAGAWSKFASPDVAAAPMFAVRTHNHYIIVTARDVCMVDTFAAPEGDTSADPRYFDEKRDATTWAISAKFRTKPINIGTAFHKSQLAQVAVDYAIHKTVSGDDNILSLKIYEDQGTVIQTYTTVEASPALTDSHRTRWVQEVFDEMTTLAIEVATVFGSHDAGEPVEYAEVQQLHVAYQAPTFRRVSD